MLALAVSAGFARRVRARFMLHALSGGGKRWKKRRAYCRFKQKAGPAL